MGQAFLAAGSALGRKGNGARLLHEYLCYRNIVVLGIGIGGGLFVLYTTLTVHNISTDGEFSERGT